MAVIRGWEFPEELYYLVDKHVWVEWLPAGIARLGLTPVAYKLLRNSLVAISIKKTSLGREVPKGKSIAMIESLKYIGPLPAPFTGVLLRGNERVLSDPDLAMADPYREGWIAEMRPTDLAEAQAGLLTGEAALSAYRLLLTTLNLSALEDVEEP